MEVNQDINARRGSKRSGVCQRGIYDNMKTAVEAIFVGKARHYNRRFVQMCSHHLIEPVGRKPRRSPLGITTPFGGFNGGVLATPDLAIIAEHLLSPEIVRRAVDMLKACGAEVWLFSGHDWLVGHSDEPYVALEERTEGFPPTIVEDFGAALDTNAKIVGVSADFELLARCERDAHASLIDQASVVRSQPYYLDITHPLANKGVALSEIANLLAVPLTEVAVIGDGGNDVAMFERSS